MIDEKICVKIISWYCPFKQLNGTRSDTSTDKKWIKKTELIQLFVS
jgi:hypothetical protein